MMVRFESAVWRIVGDTCLVDFVVVLCSIFLWILMYYDDMMARFELAVWWIVGDSCLIDFMVVLCSLLYSIFGALRIDRLSSKHIVHVCGNAFDWNSVKCIDTYFHKELATFYKI